MRPVHLADIEVAVRVLLAYPPANQDAIMSQLIAKADVADRYRKRVRRPHPTYGNGTIMSAAAHYQQVARPRMIEGHALDALARVIEALADRRGNQLL